MRYTTITAVKQWSDIFSAADDEMIGGVIDGYSRLMDEYCRQVLGRRVVTDLYEGVYGVVEASGRLIISVPAPDVAALTAVTIEAPGRTPVTLTASDLRIRKAKSGTRLVSTGTHYGHVRGRTALHLDVLISGTLGYEVIPDDLELMARQLVHWGYSRRQTPAEKTAIPEMGIVVIPTNWPPHVKAGLSAYVRHTAA